MREIFNAHGLRVYEDGGTMYFECLGFWDFTKSSWDFKSHMPKDIAKIVIDGHLLRRISSPFLIFLRRLKLWAGENNMAMEMRHFPPGVEKIFALSQAAAVKPGKCCEAHGFFYGVGKRTIDLCLDLKAGVLFFLSLLKALVDVMFTARKNIGRNLLIFLQQTGLEALPIVAVISALVGLIMAFVSVIQLERFGAGIYVADLVALAMTREMGCLMTGVIMAGRTGAAFAASIGSMQANEELDALQTFGIDRMAYLVVPRVIALALMMPLLCIFADLIGIVSGMISSLPFTKSSPMQYFLQTKKALVMGDILIGLIKSVIFGIIIAGIGCYRGTRCGRNATAVGEATTSAVVQGITWIIVADALFSLLITVLGV
jgi:phospholipid/cholesterol/gamma-HCH transport system permease protein